MTISNLTKCQGAFRLHIPYLSLVPGKVYGIVGPNGCGKSTLLKILGGLTFSDTGTIDREGLTPGQITLLPQKPYLMRDTVLANLTYPLTLRKIKPDQGVINQYLHLAGLTHLRGAFAPGLSSGEGQKLALIRALIFNPKLILMDETFSNMDMESQLAFEAHMLEKQQSAPITWLIISHQFATIQRLCDHILYMENGQLIEDGPSPSLARFLDCRAPRQQ